MQRPRIGHLVCIGLVLGAACPGSLAQQPPDPPPSQAQQVLETIEALKARLLKEQKPDGSWSEFGWPWSSSIVAGGHTALAAWALLQAGQDPFSEPIHKAVASLLTTSMIGTYNRSLRCMLLASLARIDPVGKYARAMQSDAEYLLQSRLGNGRWSYANPGGSAKGRSYTTPDSSLNGDNSNTQFAVLALREAAMAGAAVPQNVWREIRDYWVTDQNDDGGFGYNLSDKTSYGSMTAAGTASLFITEDMVRGGRCCAGEQPESIVKALGWLSANFSSTQNPRHEAYYMYWMYSIERVAETSGYRSFGDHDWFREGAAAIVQNFRRRPGRRVGHGLRADLSGQERRPHGL